jgi:hypothetical protein
MDYLQEHSLYVVAIISVVIWLGVFTFMMRISGRVSKLEK